MCGHAEVAQPGAREGEGGCIAGRLKGGRKEGVD